MIKETEVLFIIGLVYVAYNALVNVALTVIESVVRILYLLFLFVATRAVAAFDMVNVATLSGLFFCRSLRLLRCRFYIAFIL